MGELEDLLSGVLGALTVLVYQQHYYLSLLRSQEEHQLSSWVCQVGNHEVYLEGVVVEPQEGLELILEPAEFELM